MNTVTRSLCLGSVMMMVLASSTLANPIRQTSAVYQPPIGCPPGFQPATYPLNAQLGCLPTQIQAEPTQPDPVVKIRTVEFQALPPGGCPPGWVAARSPLNFQLGCLPTQLQFSPNPR
ncbi:MAG: hypothetical protein WCD18_27565 [Thermosynechococcaceae cyanobacterium]